MEQIYEEGVSNLSEGHGFPEYGSSRFHDDVPLMHSNNFLELEKDLFSD